MLCLSLAPTSRLVRLCDVLPMRRQSLGAFTLILGVAATLSKAVGNIESWLPWGLLTLGAVAVAVSLPLTISERQDH